MKAIVITRPGGPEVLVPAERVRPVAGAGEILVRVHAAGVNRADLLQRRGAYPPPEGAPLDIPGLEYAGVVEAVADGVTRFSPGDAVMGLTGGGGYAEFVVVNVHEAIPIPAGLTLEQAAAIPEAFITAHDALFTQCALAAGETVLIHAVGSGVGTAGVQLAKSAGARVIGTARSAAKLDRTRQLGMDIGIQVENADFSGDVISAIGANAVHVVLELAGGDYVTGDVAVLAPFGRIALVGLVAGRSATIDLGALLSKRALIRGTTMRSRTLAGKIAAAQAFDAFARKLFAAGTLRPIVDRVFALDDAPAAHAYLEGNENFGKVILRVPS